MGMSRTNSHFDANVFFVQRMLEQLEQYLIDISSESLCIEKCERTSANEETVVRAKQD